MRLLVVLAIGLMGLTACDTDKGGYTIVEAQIIGFEFQDSVPSGERVEVNVSFWGANGCSSEDHLYVYTSNDTVYVSAYFKQPKGRRDCIMSVPVFDLSFELEAEHDGTYIIRSATDTNIIDTLTVI